MDRHGIAARIRGLIGGQDRGDLAEAAGRLGVAELSLRMTVDDLSPHPTIEVLAAIVRAYGVDPGWLLSGEYSSATHREAATLEENGPRGAITALLQRMVDLNEQSGGHVFQFPSAGDSGKMEH